MVHGREDAFAHGKTVVHRPALDLLIQAPDHVANRHAPRAVDRFLDLGQERLDASPRWFDQHLAVAPTPDRLPKKVEAVLNMRDSGLLVGEFETPLLQELLHERFDFILKENLGRARDDEVVRIANQVDLAPRALAARCAEAFRQQPLQSIQGSIRQCGGNRPSHNLANRYITVQTAIPRDRLRPMYGQGCRQAEDGVPPRSSTDEAPGGGGHGRHSISHQEDPESTQGL